MATDSQLVLLDTDIGSDIDDAVALAYLLRQPRCKLLGITTVSGNTAQRAACAEVLCKEMGRTDIPIHAGLSEVLVCGPGQPVVQQYPAILKRPHRTDWPKNTAIDYLRSQIRAHPGEITLFSIGPFTNVGALFAVDPEIPSLLKSFVSMAGVFYPGDCDAEWNVKVDPISSALVYNPAGVRAAFRKMPGHHLNVGLDVTLKCQLPPDDVRRRFSAPAAKPLNVVLDMAEVFFKEAKTMTFHDPLAAVLMFDPEVCTYETGTIHMPMEGDEKMAGKSLFTPNPDGPHRVAKTVNAPRFFEKYFGVYG